MKNKLIAGMCAAALAASCVAFTASAEDGLTSYEPTSDNVKTIGRTYYTGEGLWFSLTGAGVEYQMTGTTTEITIKGDSAAAGADNSARIGFFVDGVRVKDIMLSKASSQTVKLDLGENTQHTIKVIKLSESPFGSILIDEIKADGEITPTAEKTHKIEFIGDSITCGYGVDGENQYKSFKTSTEDGSRTYAYKTAEKLDADYSMVSYSGYGVISGYTSADTPADSQLVSTYYGNVGYTWGWLGSENINNIEWDFSYTPDLVVINLGTNDNSYTKGIDERVAEFTDGYVDLIKLVREKNPDAEILCTLGIMGNELYPAIEDAVAAYTAETGDTKVNSLEFDAQDGNNDGYGSDWHPSEVTHAKAAEKLVNKINELYGWEIDESVDISASDTKLVPVYEEIPADESSSETDSSSEESSDVSSVTDESSLADSSTADSSSAAASSSAASSSSSAASSSSTAATKDSNPTTGYGAFGASAAIIVLAAAVTAKKRK